jgi:D-glycero-D-manno-heptose 1,7-bisphosphate phosphatase
VSGHPDCPAAPWVDARAGDLLAETVAPRRALFLDRDGVINIDDGYVHKPAEVEWVPGIFELCRLACDAGFVLVVVTNQAGIARGYYSVSDFLAFTDWVHTQFRERDVPLLATYYCPHHPEYAGSDGVTRCSCRKPAPGMILAAADAFQIDLRSSILFGDKPTDIAAANAAGIGQAILVEGSPLPEFRSLDAGPCHSHDRAVRIHTSTTE